MFLFKKRKQLQDMIIASFKQFLDYTKSKKFNIVTKIDCHIHISQHPFIHQMKKVKRKKKKKLAFT